jgi:hypothetical protein
MICFRSAPAKRGAAEKLIQDDEAGAQWALDAGGLDRLSTDGGRSLVLSIWAYVDPPKSIEDW